MKLSQIALFSASVFALATPALAQEGNDGLDVIYVTAQKRTEDIQDVPLSVSTVAGEKLEAISASGMDIRFLSSRVPSLQIESSFGRAFPRFYIRGLGNTDFDINASQPVSFVYDDIVLENPVLKGMPIFDIGQVEVLRGPQGTLFGRNTPAGVIKVTSAKPTKEFEGYGTVSLGRYNTLNLDGAVSGPISETVSGRFSAMVQHRDDWVKNKAVGPETELEGYDDFAWRGQLMFEPSDQLTALLNVHGWGSNGTARVFRANIIDVGSSGVGSNFDRDSVTQDGVNKQKIRGYGANLQVDYDMGDHTLTSLTGWKSVEMFSRGDIDGGFGASFLSNDMPAPIPFDAESADALPNHSQFTQEIRLASNDLGVWDYQIGAFYFDESLDIDSFNFTSLAPGNPQNGYAIQSQDAKSYAFFGSVNYEATEALTLQAGLRYTKDEKDFHAERFQTPIGFTGALNIAQPADQSSDDDFVSWDLSATYAVDENTNVFARVARGQRAPSFQGRLLFGDVITRANTEEVTSYEAGIKTTSPDNRLRSSVTLFRWDANDLQLTAVGGGANFNQLVNAKAALGYGFEAETEFAATDNLLFTGGVSYNKTEIDDPDLAIQPCGGGCTVLDPAGSVAGTVSIDGNPLPHAPEWIFNGTAQYTQDYANGKIFFLGDVAYASEKNFFLYESTEFKDNLLEFGARVGYKRDDGSYEAAIYARNIFNDESLEGGIDFNNLTGFVNEPAIYGVELTKRF